MISDYSLHRSYLRTQFRRRSMVVAFYSLVVALTAVAIFRQRFFPEILLIQTLTFGGLFGGITRSGPVKPYGEPKLPIFAPDPDDSKLIPLNLKQPRPFESKRLDERERHERDHAHYTAFVILRWTLTLGAIVFWLGTACKLPRIGASTPVLLWALVVFVLSLPQSVILWTEADALGDSEPQLVQTS